MIYKLSGVEAKKCKNDLKYEINLAPLRLSEKHISRRDAKNAENKNSVFATLRLCEKQKIFHAETLKTRRSVC